MENWGNNPDNKHDGSFRIGFQNIGMQQLSAKSFNATSTTRHILSHLYDIFLFAEHGLNQSKMQAQDHWNERIPFHYSILTYNKTELDRAAAHQYGGTGIVCKEEATARKFSHGCDESGLG